MTLFSQDKTILDAARDIAPDIDPDAPDSDLWGYFLGPMPLPCFLETYLPSTTAEPRGTSSFTAALTGRQSMPLGQRIMEAASGLMPSLVIKDTHDLPDEVCGVSTTLSLYPKSDAPTGTDFMLMEAFVQVFPSATDDPFHDQGKGDFQYPFETRGPAHQNTRHQLSLRVSAFQAMQSRGHVFVVLIVGEYARLMRWDPSGVIVTKRFNYTEDTESNILPEFFTRFDEATPFLRGRDTSFTAVEDEWPIHIAPHDVLDRLRAHHEIHGVGTEPRSRHRRFSLVKVPHQNDKKVTRDFLVSIPFKYPPTSRSALKKVTRSGLAYDPSTGELVFLKQYWRPYLDVRTEGEVYLHLKSHGVKYLPEFGTGNDLSGYSTHAKSPEMCEAPRTWGFQTRPFVVYRLYRMTLKTIGIPLTEAKSVHELLTVMRHAMICQNGAFFVADVLHGNISLDSILIDHRTHEGMLVDWDVDDLNLDTGSRQRIRSGKLASKNVDQYNGNMGGLDISDDRESALWVLLSVLLLRSRPEHLMGFTDADRLHLLNPHQTRLERLRAKARFLQDGTINDKRPFRRGSALDQLFSGLITTFTSCYPWQARLEKFFVGNLEAAISNLETEDGFWTE